MASIILGFEPKEVAWIIINLVKLKT
jgi:hypothetical protein